MSKDIHKVSDDFFKRIEEDSKFVRDTQKEANLKLRMRKKKLFPIIKDDSIFVYRLSSTKETDKIVSEYSDSLCDIYDVVTNDEKIKNDFYFRSSYSPYFRNLLHHHISTREDLYRYYKLDKIENRDSFLNLPQNQIFKIDDEMKFDEIVEEMAKYYFTFVFKKPSKISKIISFTSRYLDIDYVASEIYYFLNSESRDFFTGTSPIDDEHMELSRINFTDKEMNVSENEKISLIKNIIDSFKIECVYNSKIDEMNEFLTSSIFGTKSKNLVLKFAQHNSNLINDSEFSPLYKKIISSKTKCLINK